MQPLSDLNSTVLGIVGECGWWGEMSALLAPVQATVLNSTVLGIVGECGWWGEMSALLALPLLPYPKP
jgi:hypothetical protein